MYTLSLVLYCVFVIVTGVNIKYGSLDRSYFAKNPETVLGTVIIPDRIPKSVQSITITGYEPGAKQVILIGFFPNLEEVFILNAHQNSIPQFKLSPRLTRLELQGNLFKVVNNEVFSGVPVTEFNLHRNQISVIEDSSFGPETTVVSLSCNQLKTFSSTWFQDPTSLKDIDLTGNFLSTVGSTQFNAFPNLRNISLAYNSISEISEYSFSHRKNFGWLFLNHNILTQIPSNIFSDDSCSIQYFNIEDNNITFLAPELLKKMRVVTRLKLGNNPWQCPCWDEIKEWIHKDEVIGRDQNRPICVMLQETAVDCVRKFDYESVEHYRRNTDPPSKDRNSICRMGYFEMHEWLLN